MKPIRTRLQAALLILALCLSLLAQPAALAAPRADEIVILFTHDLHSNFLPFTRTDGEQATKVGGFARLKTVMDEARAGVDALVVDAGDFSMGTLFQTIFASQASELRMLGRLGFDATTFGNHEFDFGTQGLVDMLRSAAASGDLLPQLLFHPGNLTYAPLDSPVTLAEDFADAMYAIGAQQTMILEKNGIKIGLFSVMGEDAVDCSPTMILQPPGIKENAKTAVKQLQAEGAELIVCLSHSGTREDSQKSEDELLAKAVPEIDVIISGHTHTLLPEPIIHGDTVIASCGEYGQHLGKMVLKRSDGRWAVKSYELLPVDEAAEENTAIATEIGQFKTIVEQQYLSRFGGLTFDQILARADFPDLRFDVYQHHGESLLGNLIADAYKAAGEQGDIPVDCAVVPAGTIRWALPQGDLSLADVFNVSSLGVGPDELSGYPLIDLYLTGQELYNAAEVDASVTALMADAQLYFSGLGFSFDPKRLIFNKVTDVWLIGQDGARIEIQRSATYRLVCGLYTAQMLGSVKDKSFGLLSIVPKDENGEEITDFYSRIVYDAFGAEAKEWYAIASTLMQFPPDADGVPHIPDTYAMPQGRKVVEEQGVLQRYVTKLNKISILLYSIVLLVLLAVVVIIYRLATRRKRSKGFGNGRGRSRNRSRRRRK